MFYLLLVCFFHLEYICLVIHYLTWAEQKRGNNFLWCIGNNNIRKNYSADDEDKWALQQLNTQLIVHIILHNLTINFLQ